MKKKFVIGMACMLLAGSLVACGNSKDRYGKDPDFDDPTIYDSKWAEQEIAGWSFSDSFFNNIKNRIDKDVIEMQVDGTKVTFPACVADVVENPKDIDFEGRMFPSGTEDFMRYVEADTENCFFWIVADNQSGEELYQGEMACYEMEIEPRHGDTYVMDVLGIQVTKDTKPEDIIAVLGEPEEVDNGDLIYYFNKGSIEFCFDHKSETNDFEELQFHAPGWN